MVFQPNDFNDLNKAKALLEHPGIAAKITNIFGTPIEKGFERLPENWTAKIGEVTRAALWKAVHAATSTMKDAPFGQASTIWHKIAVAAAGGAGGFFGLGAFGRRTANINNHYVAIHRRCRQK